MSQTQVTGVVLGPDGQPYINAQITASSTTVPGTFTTYTDLNGNILGPYLLPADTYNITVSTPGIAPPLGLGKQQFTAFAVAISGATQDISASLLAASFQLVAGLAECQRLTVGNVYIGQYFSAVVSDTYEIGLGFTTEIMANGTLEVL